MINNKRQKTTKLLALILLIVVAIITTACGNGGSAKDYSDLVGTYYSKIEMNEDLSVYLYLQVKDDGTFTLARDTKFDSEEKGAGSLGADSEGNDAFIYTVVNGEEVEGKSATFEKGEDGSIQFTSPMWFGSTEPKFTGADGSISYPKFMIYDDEAEKIIKAEEEAKAKAKEEEEKKKAEEEKKKKEEEEKKKKEEEEKKKAEEEEKKKAEEEKKKKEEEEKKRAEEEVNQETNQETEETYYEEENPETIVVPGNGGTSSNQEPVQEEPIYEEPQSSFSEGTYYGSMSKYVDAMGSTINYDVAITFSGGSYTYNVGITVSGGMDYSGSESKSGTYSVDGDSIYMTGEITYGQAYGNAIDLSGWLSSFASGQDTVTVYR